MLRWLLVLLINAQEKEVTETSPNRHPKEYNDKNVHLKVDALKRWMFGGKKDAIAHPPEGYELQKEYDLTKLDLEDWDMGPSWGDYHPKFLNTYFDKTGETIETDSSGIMKLGVKFNPKTFVGEDDRQIKIPYVRGRLHSKLKFRYGWFEAMVKQPKGKNQWAAFWLTGAHSWPPEIDIFEAYSDESIKYHDGRIKYGKIKPNLHYGKLEDNNKEEYGARGIPVRKATERFVHYACLWEEDRIEIYYDGYLAFSCTDPEILKWYNMGHNWMTLIISNNVVEGKMVADDAYMEVKDLKVYKKQ